MDLQSAIAFLLNWFVGWIITLLFGGVIPPG